MLVGLYVLDPAGAHGTSWIFGTRLLVEVLALLLAGVVLAPRATLVHLVRAMVRRRSRSRRRSPGRSRLAGPAALVYGWWGYEYGSQVRIDLRAAGCAPRARSRTRSSSPRSPCSALALALFVASRWQAAVLIVSAVAVLGATSVRTAMLQAGLLLVVVRGQPRLRPGGGGAGRGRRGGRACSSWRRRRRRSRPGAPEEPLLLTLNGRSDAWALAVDGWESLVTGNGVGARGTGSTRTEVAVTGPPQFDGSAPDAAFAGNPAFLDSSYAQVQSDVGIVGSAALLTALAGHGGRPRAAGARRPGDGAAWAALGVLGGVDGRLDRPLLAGQLHHRIPHPLRARRAAGRRPDTRSARDDADRRTDRRAGRPAGWPSVGLAAAMLSRLMGRLVGIVLVIVLARQAGAGDGRRLRLPAGHGDAGD